MGEGVLKPVDLFIYRLKDPTGIPVSLAEAGHWLCSASYWFCQLQSSGATRPILCRSNGAGRHSPQQLWWWFSTFTAVNQALQLAKFILRMYVTYTCPCPVPWLERTSNLALQMSKATSWEYYLGTASMHSVSQDSCKTLSLPHHRFPVTGPCTLYSVRSE